MHPKNSLHPWWYGTSAFLFKNGEYFKIGDSIPNFNDVIYEKENKTMANKTYNDRINGKTIKHSIKDGMQVVLRDGSIRIVDTLIDGEMYLIGDKGPYRLSNYNDCMCDEWYGNGSRDVVAIYSRPDSFPAHIDDLMERGFNRKLLWERDEARRMTKEEIEKALGYKINIKED